MWVEWSRCELYKPDDCMAEHNAIHGTDVRGIMLVHKHGISYEGSFMNIYDFT